MLGPRICHGGISFGKVWLNSQKKMHDEVEQNKDASSGFYTLTVFFIFRAVFIWTIIIILKVVGWFLIIEHMTHRAY